MKKLEPKKCPVCGRSAFVERAIAAYYVSCTKSTKVCEAWPTDCLVGPERACRAGAIKAWNGLYVRKRKP